MDHGDNGFKAVDRGPYEELTVEEETVPVATSSHWIALHGGFRELFLFPNSETTNSEEFFFACLVIILLTFLLEIGRYYASKFENSLVISHKGAKRMNQQDYSTFPSLTLQHQLNSCPAPSQLPASKASWCRCANIVVSNSWLWVLTGVSHFVIHFLSILFMLIAMTFNIYLILSLCCGVTCGKLFVIYVKQRSP